MQFLVRTLRSKCSTQVVPSLNIHNWNKKKDHFYDRETSFPAGYSGLLLRSPGWSGRNGT
jgi:hypothetical protein